MQRSSIQVRIASSPGEIIFGSFKDSGWRIQSWKIERHQTRDLMDALALKFLDVYRRISRCKREGCNKLFIRVYPNDKYCSRLHAEEARLIAQRDWMRDHRAPKDAKQKKAVPKAKSRRKR
jgi:hypothetical protein